MVNFDPSKMDPKVMMELSELVQKLPPEKLQQMQSLMHNMMAGFDVKREMEEFEKGLPPGFRETVMSLMASQAKMEMTSQEPAAVAGSMDVHKARMTILEAVADGKMTPEEAEKLLFN